jgi:hypothetical protein
MSLSSSLSTALLHCCLLEPLTLFLKSFTNHVGCLQNHPCSLCITIAYTLSAAVLSFLSHPHLPLTKCMSVWQNKTIIQICKSNLPVLSFSDSANINFLHYYYYYFFVMSCLVHRQMYFKCLFKIPNQTSLIPLKNKLKISIFSIKFRPTDMIVH